MVDVQNTEAEQSSSSLFKRLQRDDFLFLAIVLSVVQWLNFSTSLSQLYLVLQSVIYGTGLSVAHKYSMV
jgi:hypothetical protein